MSVDIPNFPAWIADADACAAGAAWVGVMDFATFWTTCPRPDWMLWVLHNAMLQSLAGFPASRADVVGIANAAINLSTSPYQGGLFAHVAFYSNQTDLVDVPMVLDDDLFNGGAFGNISAVADSVRSAVSV